jgi:hypothetical protein
MADNAPKLFSNTLYTVRFNEIDPPNEATHFVIKLHQNSVRDDGVYQVLCLGPVLMDTAISMPVLIQWTPSMFLHTFAHSMWLGEDIYDPLDKVYPGTRDYTPWALEVMAVNLAYGPIDWAWNPTTGRYEYHVDPETGNVKGVYLSHAETPEVRRSYEYTPIRTAGRFEGFLPGEVQ